MSDQEVFVKGATVDQTTTMGTLKSFGQDIQGLRKLIVTCLAIVAFVILKLFAQDIQSIVDNILTLVLAYIGGQSAIDVTERVVNRNKDPRRP